MEEKEVKVTFVLDPLDTEGGLWEWLDIHCPYLHKTTEPDLADVTDKLFARS